MAKKKKTLPQFENLTWAELDEWVGPKILSRGLNYQRQGCVSGLSVTDDDALIAWVSGSRHYVTLVEIADGFLYSICTCPYGSDCKHAVAVVLEYLAAVEENRPVPLAKEDDERFEILDDEELDDPDDDDDADDDAAIFDESREKIDAFLKQMKKAQLIELVHKLCRQHPEIAEDLLDQQELETGNVKDLIKRLRRDIREISADPGWQNYWHGDGYIPDYSEIRGKLEALLDAGHADEVLTIGKILVENGMRQVEESHDDGETEEEVASCMPIIVEALDQSSLEPVERLNWALDVVLADQFSVSEAFAEYLFETHPQPVWSTLADRLTKRLKSLRSQKDRHDFEREEISHWLIHCLEQAGRNDEILPLLESEAKKTLRYDRLISWLIAKERYEEAEKWIWASIQKTEKELPGIARNLRSRLLEIRERQENWPVVAAIYADRFVGHPALHMFTKCKIACDKIKCWPQVRQHLLSYLENGQPPWRHEKWPLPASGLGKPDPPPKSHFPKDEALLEIAIFENDPDQVLYWYDQTAKRGFERHKVDLDTIAEAVRAHAPDRAVEIWQKKAENLIALVKPKAYEHAAVYLRKARKSLCQTNRQADWEQYLQDLKNTHFRKKRLMEILNGFEQKPILKKQDSKENQKSKQTELFQGKND